MSMSKRTNFSCTATVAAFAALLVMPFVSAYTYDSAFLGCVTASSYTPNGVSITGQSTAAGCASSCYASDSAYIYSALLNDGNTMTCRCATYSPVSSTIDTGNSGGCDTVSYEVNVIHTTFDFYECTGGYEFSAIGFQGTTASFEDAFAACAGYPFVAIWPSEKYYYACGTGPITQDASKTCGYQVVRIYSHPADATASGLARRSLEERRRAIQQQTLASRYCPIGKTACALEGDATSYECIDTRSELESCGGCLHGNYLDRSATYNSTMTYGGQDCTNIEGVAMGGSTCLNGRCEFACSGGYKRKGDGCVKL